MPSKRQQILAAVVERLEVIHTNAGYQTDAGQALYIGETPSLGPDDPDVAIAIVVGSEEAARQGHKKFARLTYEIQAVARVGLQTPWLLVEAVIDDIQSAMERQSDMTLGGLVLQSLEPEPIETLPREDGSTVVGAAVPYRAEFETTWGNP